MACIEVSILSRLDSLVLQLYQVRLKSCRIEIIKFSVCVQIGVNSLFLLVNSVKYQDSSLPLEKRVGLALAEVGPSITLASLTEFVVFSVGVFSSAPACQVLSGFLGKILPLPFWSCYCLIG